MAEWKKVIVSGSDAHLSSVTASNMGAASGSDSVVFKGSDGEIRHLSNLTFNGTNQLQFNGGTFSGSFIGDASGLTGVVTTLGFSGSLGTGSVDLKTQSLLITGSQYGIVASASGQTLTLSLDDRVSINQLEVVGASGSFTGSFIGDGSGLTGVASTLIVSASNNTSGSLDLKTAALIVSGTAQEVDVDFNDTTNTLTFGLPDDVHIQNLSVSSSLFVSSSATFSGSIFAQSASFDWILSNVANRIHPITASYAANAQSTAINSGQVIHVTPASTTWTVQHNLATDYPIVEIWDESTNRIIQPDEITRIDANTIQIDFTTAIAGYANVSRAGHVVSGSVLWENLITGSGYNPANVAVTLNITGSVTASGGFTGSFTGDGSGLTGVVAEWDGSHLGDASITGSFYVSGSAGTIIDFTGVDAISGSIFSGSFVGDGSGLTGIATSLVLSGSVGNKTLDLKTEELLLTGSENGIVVTVTNETASFALDTDINIAGDLTVAGATSTNGLSVVGASTFTGSMYVSGAAGTIVDMTGVDAISGSIFSGSFVGDGSGLTGLATNLDISGSDGTGISLDLLTQDLKLTSGSNASQIKITATGQQIQIGLTDSVDIAQNLTVGGDLTVNGTTTYVNTTEILIEDKFALFASGSTSPTDGGIIIQSGLNGSNVPTGSAFGIDASANRWALQTGFTSPGTSLTPDAYMTTTEFGLASAKPANPTYGGATNGYGNIWVSTDTSDIWIWA